MRKDERLGVRENRIESKFHIGRRERAAIVKVDTAAQVKNVGERVGCFPGFSEVAANIHLGIAFDQAAEEQAMQALGLDVGADAGIETGRHGFDKKCNGAGRRGELTRASGEKSAGA